LIVSIALVLSLVCAGWMIYTWLLYPLLVIALGSVRGDPGDVTVDEWPSVTLLISAHNEEAVIRQKLVNALSLEYAGDLRIIVSSDGCDDATNQIVTEMADRAGRITLMAYPTNRGKTAALMETLGHIESEVVVFSDANAMYAEDAVEKLVRHFARERVGAVAGELRHRGASAERLFRRYENRIKAGESKLASCLVAEGSIFAARRALIPALDRTHLEDLSIPLAIALSGYRVLYERSAVSVEDFELSYGSQYRRRKRIVNRAIRSTMARSAIFNPVRHPLLCWMFVSHRIMRWGSPFAISGLVVGLATIGVFAFPSVGAVAFAGGVAGVSLPNRYSRRLRNLALAFVVANGAVAAGILSAVAGRRIVTWTPQR
jgi:cellulose synthase/poly-beta-1,6-N-acetylglucosamine synthase-like glycosyltransferase